MKKLLSIGLAALLLECAPFLDRLAPEPNYYELTGRIRKEKCSEGEHYDIQMTNYIIKRTNSKRDDLYTPKTIRIRFNQEDFDAESLDARFDKGSELTLKLKDNFNRNNPNDYTVVELLDY